MAVNNFESIVNDDGSVFFDMEYVDECCGGHSGCYHYISHSLSAEEAQKLYVKLWRVFQGRGDDGS